jgi:hypothetical protein
VSLIPAWVGFPLLLVLIGAGWGVVVERAAGISVSDVLILPLGLAAAIVVAGTLTTFSATAPAAITVVAVGAAAGLILLVWVWPRPSADRDPAAGPQPAFERRRAPRRLPLPGLWAALAAVGALLVYGAPVLLSGQATFTGFLKLDDTGTWFNVVDIVMSHSNSITALNEAFHPPSTFSAVFTADVGEHYPLGAFMLLGVGHGLTGLDPAWIIQPYFACCAAALALGIYALVAPLVPSPRLRALVAFLGAQSALLFGYSLWGGIKEMTAAFLLVLGVALIAPLLRRPVARPRELIPLAVAGGALIQTLQIGGGGWVAPAALILVLAWLWPRGGVRRLRASAASLGILAALTAAFTLPVWVSLSSFLSSGYHGLFSEGQTAAEKYGNLVKPISGWQLGGIWLSGDFRFPPPALPTTLFIVVAMIAAAAGLWFSARRRQFGVLLYVAVALLAIGIIYVSGATFWVMGKALSISSPAVLTAALAGAAVLWSSRRAPLPPLAGGAQAGPQAAPPDSPRGASARRERPRWPEWPRRHVWVLGPLAMLIIGVGVLWSNVLAYRDVTLAPRARLLELQHVGKLLAGKGPTFVNEFEAYAGRHFLREGAPVEPAEYRPVTLPLRSGAILTKSASANLDGFPLSTLGPYRSIVTRRSPTESRPPSVYQLVWQGHYYQLWQRPETPSLAILEHIPFGEENAHPYCGNASNQPSQPICSISPVSVPPCPQLLGFARRAAERHATLLAYQRAEPTFTRGDEVLWPRAWIHEAEGHALIPTTPGTALGHIAVPTSQLYELFLGGSFGRGFEVRVDGRKVGAVKNQLAGYTHYVPVTQVYLTRGVHTFEYTYPHADLTPGDAETLDVGEYAPDVRFTSLSAVALQPLEFPPSELISARPANAKSLCGRPLDWVELVRGGPAGP